MLNLADVYEGLTGARPADAEGVALPDVVIDSRLVTPGALFVALKGERSDGHDFIGDALGRGAAAVIAEARARSEGLGPSARWVDVAGLQPSPGPSVPAILAVPSSLEALQRLAAYWRRRHASCAVVGITGSVGKSSTKELVVAVLKQRYRLLKSKGNYNNEIGLPLTLLKLEPEVQVAVLEMGTYALGEIAELCRIAQPSIGIVTNVGVSHLERLGTVERIAEAKSELPRALPASGTAILNGDDPRVRAMGSVTPARVCLYGVERSNDLWADEIQGLGLNGIGFVLHHGQTSVPVRLPLLGRHNVYTALAAAAVGIAEEMSWEDIVRGLQDESARLRLVVIPGQNGTTVLDDSYNASPSSSLAALALLAELPGRRIAVLGDMLELGEMELPGHQSVGRRAAQVVDALVAVGARGRWIGEEARRAGLDAERVFFAETNSQAIDILRRVLRAGDIILVKGSRGAKMEEVVAAVAQPKENVSSGENGWPIP